MLLGVLVALAVPSQAVTVKPIKTALDYLQYMCDDYGAMTVFLMNNAKAPMPIGFQYLGVQEVCEDGFGYDPTG